MTYVKAEAIDYPDYEVVEVEEPKLYEELFPWVKPPVIVWDGVSVPIEVAEELWITDTTFRDGQQAREPYAIEEMVTLYKYLHRIGGPKGKILFTECFLYTDRDKEAVRRMKALGYEAPKVTGWIRASLSDLKLVKEMKLEETGMLASISDYHIFYKFKGLSR
ncbi:MAG TPA: 2-isopropylmalate synthase, partial [Candidatus Methanomethylia archaeon]|nr:2-isopropylmalate synthase [Candidatus Methanomethylicia archaeon]